MNVTRGFGVLEKFLANKRLKIVNKNIPDNLREGRILDIGCGNFPYFLSNIKFKEKVGLDKESGIDQVDGIKLIKHDLSKEDKLPFTDSSFDVVTILAVLEHMSGDFALKVLKEVKRVLKEEGELFITVPRDKGDKLLRLFSKIGLVSRVELDEHVQLYNPKNIREQLKLAGFYSESIKVRPFELGLNLFIEVKNDVK